MESLRFKGNQEAKKISDTFFKGLLAISDFESINDQVLALRELGFDHKDERPNIINKYIAYYHENKNGVKKFHLIQILDITSNQICAIASICKDIFTGEIYTIDTRKLFHMYYTNSADCRYFQGTRVFDSEISARNYINLELNG